DGAESGRVRELAAAGGARWIRVQSLDDPAARERLAAKDFAVSAGKIYHHRRQLTDGELLFLVNSSLDTPAKATVRAAGRSLARLDAVTGTESPYPARIESGRLAFSVELPPAGSLLLVASPEGALVPEQAQPSAARPVEPVAPLKIKRAAPNVLMIDYCDLKVAGAVAEDLPVYKAATTAFQKHGFPEGNPWNTAVQYKSSILDRNHFPPDSGFEAVYRFEVAPGVVTKALEAVVERPALWKVAVNGQTVEPKPGAWWLDAAFGVYDIGAHVKPGANAISVSAHPMSVHAEIEPVYVLGEFGVAPVEKGFRIVPASPLAVGEWKEQALPFYSDAVSYARSYKLRTGASYSVRLGKWSGTVAEVKVNGATAGIIGWAPYEVDISRLVRKGRNEVEVVVYGSLKNLLGAHHGKRTPGFVTPWSWRNAPVHTPPGAQYDFYGYGLTDNFEVVTLP
ncbi:MAG TPA: hypothetical protein VHA11_03500, partial [Bryobacteraceae bacterium]|nr:hypothetical protein [Bryobacteraceae bacterium]